MGYSYGRRLQFFLRAPGQLKRGFQVLTPGGMFFRGMGAVEKGIFFFFYKHKAEVQESTFKLRKGEPIIQK